MLIEIIAVNLNLIPIKPILTIILKNTALVNIFQLAFTALMNSQP